jgi:hypothetical protein
VIAIRAAKQLVAKVASIAEGTGRFVIVSDSGPVGWTFLDRGAAYASYGPGMVMRRTYPMRSTSTAETAVARKRLSESKFGKVLGGPWNYVLLGVRDVRRQNWTLGELNGKFSNEVPAFARRDDQEYRRSFSKPYNIAVQEFLNDAREGEIIKKKNARSSSSSIGRSDDPAISHWWA